MKLSIIVPINKMDNIKECINSIKNQTIDDYEIIISCEKNIENELKKDFQNTKIITSLSNKEETLINNGIKASKGNYISIINQNMILNKKMYEEALYQQADICLLSYKENNKKIKLEPFCKLSSIIKIDDNLNNKIFKRNIVENNLLSLDDVISKRLFIYKAVASANTFGFVHDICYICDKKDTVIKIEQIYKTYDEIIKYYIMKKLYEKNKSKLEYVVVNDLLGNTFKLLRKQKNKELLEKNWEYIIKKFPNWKKNLYIRRMPGLKSALLRITNKTIYNIKSKI